MEVENFLNWLMISKKLNYRSAKDVLSRCRRIAKMCYLPSIGSVEEHILEDNLLFKSCSMYVKSQLKRSNRLLLEWENTIKD